MPEPRIAQYISSFRNDLSEILAHSERQFGMAATGRYAKLIERALRDLLQDPERPGTSTRPGLASDVRLYHLSFSRVRAQADRVNSPRHFILYRFTEKHVQFARLLHDSRDLNQHVPEPLKS